MKKNRNLHRLGKFLFQIGTSGSFLLYSRVSGVKRSPYDDEELVIFEGVYFRGTYLKQGWMEVRSAGWPVNIFLSTCVICILRCFTDDYTSRIEKEECLVYVEALYRG